MTQGELLEREEREESAEQKLDLLDVLLVFARRKWVIIFWTLAGLLCGLVFMLGQPTLYRADATIMPPQQEQSSSALLGQLGVLTAFSGGGGGAALGLKNPADLYLGLLGSRSVNDDLVVRFHLQDVYKVRKVSQAAGTLLKRARFKAGKDSLISISVEDKDPKRAAVLANGYVDELYHLNNRLAIGEAAQRRQFFDQQLAAEKDRLADAEVALKKTQLSTGLLEPTSQAATIIRAEAEIRANITSREVQLAALRSSSTEQNSDVIRLRTELTGLSSQLNQLQKGEGPSGSPASVAQLPAAALSFLRAEREVKYHQTLFDLLARQLESARLDEAKASPTIQIVDRAQVPEIKSWPSKALFLGVGAILGFVLGCMRCVVVYLYDFADTDPRFRTRFTSFKRTMRLSV